MRTRKYTLAVLTLSAAAAMAIGWAAQTSANPTTANQTIAGSAGGNAKITRESAFVSAEPAMAGSAGGDAKITRESS